MKKLSLNLDELRVVSFDTLPEISDAEAEMAAGARAASSCDRPGTCFALCTTGDETVVCCYPTQGNGSGGGGQVYLPAPGNLDPRVGG